MESETLTILGSTGSIGVQTLKTLEALPGEWRLNYLTTNTRIDILERQTLAYKPRGIAIADESAYRAFCKTTSFKGKKLCGEDGALEAAADAENTSLVSALVGFAGVKPTLAAIEAGAVKRIALANKESLVSAGGLIMSEAKLKNIEILPIDSEHSAIMQCLRGEDRNDVEILILTASGGPFLNRAIETFDKIRPQDALRHPTWNMGAKITIDSATLMNKGFEVIEARWLFGLPHEKIKAVIHPQSVIHSMVQFNDGSVKAQLGEPDMRAPIAYALAYPRHVKTDFPRLDLLKYGELNFLAPDLEKFPCLRYAYHCLEREGSYSVALNAANEIAVRLFLDNKIKFADISRIIGQALENHGNITEPTIEDIVEIDKITRDFVLKTEA